jgi:hypothetical protein
MGTGLVVGKLIPDELLIGPIKSKKGIFLLVSIVDNCSHSEYNTKIV